MVFESTILNSAVSALKRYEEIADEWLWHAPEFFLTTWVADGIAQKKWYVWCDASPQKIRKVHDGSNQGRASNDKNKRFDIVVWNKSSNTVRAIIEVKKDWSITGPRRDAEKMLRQRYRVRARPKSGYLLIYSEVENNNNQRAAKRSLERRFERWAGKLEARLVGIRIGAPSSEPWAWGFVLLRIF